MDEEKKRRILCVDDEPDNLRLLEMLLLRDGYEILSADCGGEGLSKAASEKPDLIVLDIEMPDMSGYDVLRKLRADEITRLIPVILITAFSEAEYRAKGIEAGCDDFIVRPFDRNEVLTKVDTLLKLSDARALIDETEKVEYIVDQIADGVVVFDGMLKITRINQKAATLLSIPAADTGVDFLEHLNKHFKVRYEGNLKGDLRSKVVSFDVEREATDQTKPLMLEVKSSVVRNPLREISTIVMILTDVTMLRMGEELKQNFMNLISHKLRTPVSVITESSSMLAEGVFGKLTKEQKEFASMILEKSYALGDLVEKLINFTTITSQKLDLTRQSIALKDYLTKLTSSIIQRRKDREININIDCPDGVIVEMNEAHFDLIIENLIENSIKFNDGDVVKVAITVMRTNEGTMISISDNSRGIPSEEIEKVFEKFYQVEKYFTGNVEGVGLGLALVKRLVGAYGGEIQIESAVGKGSVVNIQLPKIVP